MDKINPKVVRIRQRHAPAAAWDLKFVDCAGAGQPEPFVEIAGTLATWREPQESRSVAVLGDVAERLCAPRPHHESVGESLDRQMAEVLNGSF